MILPHCSALLFEFIPLKWINLVPYDAGDRHLRFSCDWSGLEDLSGLDMMLQSWPT